MHMKEGTSQMTDLTYPRPRARGPKSLLTAAITLVLAIGMFPTAGSTANAAGPAPVDLGTAANFAVLAGQSVTCIGPSNLVGDVGVSPGTSITGFPPCTRTGATHSADAVAAQAQSDLVSAYNAITALQCDVTLTGQDLGGLTLAPGVYCFSSSAQLTGQLTLQGGSNAVWIFQIGSALTTASNSSVVMAGNAVCGNVFWQVGSSATIGQGTAFLGNILALTSIGLDPGARVSGRALARNGAVTMSGTNTVAFCATTGGGGNGNGHGNGKDKCNQGVGNGPELCDPGNSNQGDPSRSNDERGGTPGNPGRKGGNGK